MIRQYQASITCSGSDGSATGSARFGAVSGCVKAVHLDHSAGQAATTQVVIATAHAPISTLLTITGNTDGWYYPAITLCDSSGGSLDMAASVPISDELAVTVTGADDTETVTVTVLIEVY